jgi:hypothetical protein
MSIVDLGDRGVARVLLSAGQNHIKGVVVDEACGDLEPRASVRPGDQEDFGHFREKD